MKIAQASIGGINFFVTVLTIIQNYFKYAESSDEHRKSGIGWGKFYRNISIELSVNRSHRKDPDFFIKLARNEYDRLLEESPTIPDDIIEKFNITFKKQQKNNKKKLEKLKKKSQNSQFFQSMTQIDTQNDNSIQNNDLILPDICGTIIHTKVFKDKNSDILPVISEKSDNIDYLKLLENKISSIETIINNRLPIIPINNTIINDDKNDDNDDINKKLYKKINDLENFLLDIKTTNNNIPINPNINSNPFPTKKITRSYSITNDNYINNARNILNEIKNLNKNNIPIPSTIELEKNKDSNILNDLVNKGAVKKMLNRYTIDLGKTSNTPNLNPIQSSNINTPILNPIQSSNNSFNNINTPENDNIITSINNSFKSINNNPTNDIIIDINNIKELPSKNDNITNINDNITDINDNITNIDDINIINPLHDTDTDTDTDTDNQILTPKIEDIKKIDLSNISNFKLD